MSLTVTVNNYYIILKHLIPRFFIERDIFRYIAVTGFNSKVYYVNIDLFRFLAVSEFNPRVYYIDIDIFLAVSYFIPKIYYRYRYFYILCCSRVLSQGLWAGALG